MQENEITKASCRAKEAHWEQRSSNSVKNHKFLTHALLRYHGSNS